MTKTRQISAVAFFAAIILTTLFCVVWYQRRCATLCSATSDRKNFVITDEPPPMLASPSRTTVDMGERERIKAIFDSVVVAYSNLQSDVIRELEAELPKKVEYLTDKDFQYTECAFFRLLYDDIVSAHAPLHSFSSAEEFKTHVLTDFAAIQLYGAVIKKRKDYNQFFHWIEAKELKRLGGYKEKFVCEGNAACAEAADKVIERWIDQIESPQGFTYTMALYYLERGKVRVPSPSEELIPNWEIIRNKAVAQGVEPLVANGYTPKWMDKLLKMPEPEAYYVPDYY